MRFKLPGRVTNNAVFNTRLRVKTRVQSEPVWLRAMEKNPPSPPLPRRQGWTGKKIPKLQAPRDVLLDKVLKHTQATKDGREFVKSFGGKKSFAEKFTTKQMSCIRSGMSEPKAFRYVMDEMRKELQEHQEAVTKAYSELVEARGGLSLSKFIETYASAESVANWAEGKDKGRAPPVGMEPEDMDLILDMAQVGVIDLDSQYEDMDGKKLNRFWTDAERTSEAVQNITQEVEGSHQIVKSLDAIPEGDADALESEEEVWSFDESMLIDISNVKYYSVPPSVWSQDSDEGDGSLPLLFTTDGDLVGAHNADTGEILEVEISA